MDNVTRFSLALAELGFAHKGAFKLDDHDFTLDNYAPVGDCYVKLTLDSISALNCAIKEYWEIEIDDDALLDDDLLDKTITTLKKLQNA